MVVDVDVTILVAVGATMMGAVRTGVVALGTTLVGAARAGVTVVDVDVEILAVGVSLVDLSAATMAFAAARGGSLRLSESHDKAKTTL
jgi:energy-converting hydrogenase Eha subunit E